MPTKEQTHDLSRRSVLTTAAWSAPVVLAAAAVPFASASGGGATQLDLAPVFGIPDALTPIKSNGFVLKVHDVNGVSGWSGSLSVEVFFTPDDSVIFVLDSLSVPTPSAASLAEGWTFAGWGTPGPNGVYSVLYDFTGSFSLGGAATLSIEPFSYFTFDRVGLPTSPFATTRTATISNVVGTPSTDLPANNSVSQAIVYSW